MAKKDTRETYIVAYKLTNEVEIPATLTCSLPAGFVERANPSCYQVPGRQGEVVTYILYSENSYKDDEWRLARHTEDGWLVEYPFSTKKKNVYKALASSIAEAKALAAGESEYFGCDLYLHDSWS